MNQYLKYLEEFKKIYSDDELKIDENMSKHIHFKVGGPVDILVMPSCEEQVINTLELCRKNNIPFFILGNGSNLLVKDGGLRGVVIKCCNLNKVYAKEDLVIADSGVMLNEVSKKAVEASLTGFEFACGIPGTVGGAVFMNAGAYDGEMKDVIKEVKVIDKQGNIAVLSKDELQLGYRTSRVMKEGLVVLNATFKLNKGQEEDIQGRVDELTEKRESRQPLEYPSAGSTFKRPEGYFAGKLIQDSGLKGASIGGAAVSEKHSGFIINKGGATAKDILDLIAHVQKEVKKQYNVELHPEVRVIGED